MAAPITRVRSVDLDNDWNFGQSKNDYIAGNMAIGQNIKTRLGSVLGNCFFDTASGIDWFNLLGSKLQTELNLAISSTILNTDLVTGLQQIYVDATTQRNLRVGYQVSTVYSTTQGLFVFTNNVGG